MFYIADYNMITLVKYTDLHDAQGEGILKK